MLLSDKLCDRICIIIHTVAVIHTPDMERLLTLLWILINKRVEIVNVNFEESGSIVTKRRDDFMILYLVNSILDVVLSVAATIIASLLLLSGDIEQNPGPGKEEQCYIQLYLFQLYIVIVTACTLPLQILTITVLMLHRF